ncbi:hypothetical protein FH972_022098 [Carpinus fangiana]|uniref:NDT80 domain-containing protein n=1 Tax=Carpinus fangiana TaxID=176857 RepID=A0A5N6KRS6_9ROSI|nr:hypothetical protein FH972_022098 [Carpinus fangiana]
MGFDGTTITPHIRDLIEKQHLGSILLTAKNLESAEQTTRLILELQKIAYDAGHPVPLAIAIDQENGGVNSLYDEIYVRQYPSAMGIAATGSTDLAFEVAKATAQEVSACGINWIFGPCLDTLSNARNQPLGVRAFCDDPQQVSKYGVAFMKGYQSAGLMTMGKHFPSYGNLEFLGSALDVPTITESLEQLSLSALVPFRNAIREGLDSMMVGGCAMSSAGLEVMHACLSEQVVDNLLRADLDFDGVVVSECLEMEALSHTIGIGGGTVMAVNAGCDLVLLCRSPPVQQEAINGLKLGIENSMIGKDRIRKSLQRILRMKNNCSTCNWQHALNPPGLSLLSTMQPSHTSLSTRAYNESISVVRDRNHLLPLTNIIGPEDELLLLTPLVRPLAASAAAKELTDGSQIATESNMSTSPEPHLGGWDKTAAIMSGERVFRELGRSLARQRHGRVLHTSYTSNGVRPVHENLVTRASAVIIVTADANRNLYQNGFAKHMAMICKTAEKGEKPLIVVSVSSPYDFALDVGTIGTYICTYDFTETSLNSLVGVLYGELSPTGHLPGSISKSQKLSQSRQHWLVEAFNEERDANALDVLISTVVDIQTAQSSPLSGASSSTFLLHHPAITEHHFVVRNSTTQQLYGFCSTYYFKSSNTGVIGALFVDPSRQKLSIGASLHNRAIRTLLQQKGIKRFQLGTRLPGAYLGIPLGRTLGSKRSRGWFANLGWNTALSRPICSMVARNLLAWTPPDSVTWSLQSAQQMAEFDLVYGTEYGSGVLDHIKTSSRQGLTEVYKMALGDPAACGIIRAKRPSDGAVIGTVVLYNMRSQLAEYVPAMKAMNEAVGGITSPVISPSVGEYSTLLQSLVLLGLRQIKQQGCSACLMDHMDGDGNTSSLTVMGFELLHSYEEISCDAATWTMVPPSEKLAVRWGRLITNNLDQDATRMAKHVGYWRHVQSGSAETAPIKATRDKETDARELDANQGIGRSDRLVAMENAVLARLGAISGRRHGHCGLRLKARGKGEARTLIGGDLGGGGEARCGCHMEVGHGVPWEGSTEHLTRRRRFRGAGSCRSEFHWSLNERMERECARHATDGAGVVSGYGRPMLLEYEAISSFAGGRRGCIKGDQCLSRAMLHPWTLRNACQPARRCRQWRRGHAGLSPLQSVGQEAPWSSAGVAWGPATWAPLAWAAECQRGRWSERGESLSARSSSSCERRDTQRPHPKPRASSRELCVAPEAPRLVSGTYHALEVERDRQAAGRRPSAPAIILPPSSPLSLLLSQQPSVALRSSAFAPHVFIFPMSSLHERPVAIHNPFLDSGDLHRLPGMDHFDAMAMFPMSLGDSSQHLGQPFHHNLDLEQQQQQQHQQHQHMDSNTFAAYVGPPGLAAANSDTDMPTTRPSDFHADGSVHGSVPPTSARPHLSRAATSTYDDMFSDIQSTVFDAASLVETVQQDSPSLDGDSKLLAFSLPVYGYALLDYTYRRTSIALSAQLHGMFFLAENPNAANADAPPPPRELTCYRRNLFSISGSIAVPRNLRYILTEQGEQIPIVAHELALSATESVEGNPVKIISVPWKTPAGTQPGSEERPEREPPSIPLDLMAGSEMDPDLATIPISWKRLQFRIATANNGRRKELQQHFVIKLRVMAQLSTGQRVPIAEVTSSSIIVRGRSPRNFQQKKEVPVGNSGSRQKSNHQQQQQKQTSVPEPTPAKSENNFVFDPSDLQLSPDFLDWKVPTGNVNGAMTALPADTFAMPAGVNIYSHSSPDFNRKHSPHVPAPINLFLADDDPRNGLMSPPERPNKRARMSSASETGRPPLHSAFSVSTLAESEESADQLYEYFPLGMDDWQEPVDAVYRPHVVHHVNIADPKPCALVPAVHLHTDLPSANCRDTAPDSRDSRFPRMRLTHRNWQTHPTSGTRAREQPRTSAGSRKATCGALDPSLALGRDRCLDAHRHHPSLFLSRRRMPARREECERQLHGASAPRVPSQITTPSWPMNTRCAADRHPHPGDFAHRWSYLSQYAFMIDAAQLAFAWHRFALAYAGSTTADTASKARLGAQNLRTMLATCHDRHALPFAPSHPSLSCTPSSTHSLGKFASDCVSFNSFVPAVLRHALRVPRSTTRRADDYLSTCDPIACKCNRPLNTGFQTSGVCQLGYVRLRADWPHERCQGISVDSQVAKSTIMSTPVSKPLGARSASVTFCADPAEVDSSKIGGLQKSQPVQDVRDAGTFAPGEERHRRAASRADRPMARLPSQYE